MRQYTAKTLLQTYRWAVGHPNGVIPIDRMTQLTSEEWLTWFRQCLDRKIASYIPGYGVGRKWESDWYWQAWRIARDVNTPRLVVRWVPKEFRERLQHRLFVD